MTARLPSDTDPDAVVHLCCSEEEERTILVEARGAVDWALANLASMRPSTHMGEMTLDEPAPGHLERHVGDDGSEGIRIRPRAFTTDPDVLLVEPPLRGGPAWSTAPEALRASLERWRTTLSSCVWMQTNRHLEQRRMASLIADACLLGLPPRTHLLVVPPTAHVATRVSFVAVGPDPSLDPAVAELANASIGRVRWLVPRRSSGATLWTFAAPVAHDFTAPRTARDAMSHLRAVTALGDPSAVHPR